MYLPRNSSSCCPLFGQCPPLGNVFSMAPSFKNSVLASPKYGSRLEFGLMVSRPQRGGLVLGQVSILQVSPVAFLHILCVYVKIFDSIRYCLAIAWVTPPVL